MLNVKVNPSEQFNEPKYPFIGYAKNTELLVLFIEYSHGVVLKTDKNNFYDVGHVSDAWVMVDFAPFVGSVTLTQE